MQTYLFYDIETTGLNKCFDQVLQFAAIRTDLNLKELERHEIFVKLNPDVIPAPGAMVTHRIRLAHILTGAPEYTAIKEIHELLNYPGTISLGYNTLGFDDEFLRFSFYRNLLPPYTHQYANQCSRMDLYPMAAMFYLYKNSVLNWPKIAGKVSLKLENLSAANQLAVGQAHNAMTDVEACIALAHCFMRERDMWDYLAADFKKALDEERQHKLPVAFASGLGKHQEGIMVDGLTGADQAFQFPVLSLGKHNHYKNQTLWLRLDRIELSTATPDSIAEATWVIRRKPAEPQFVLPPIERFTSFLSAERRGIAEENKKFLQANPDLFSQIIQYHREYQYPIVPNTDIDAALYMNGFWSPVEENFCRKFHQVMPKEKAQLALQTDNPKLQAIATRIIGRNYPELLTGVLAEKFAGYLRHVRAENAAEVLIDFQGRLRLTPAAALTEIALLRAVNMDAEQKMLLDELEMYIQSELRP